MDHAAFPVGKWGERASRYNWFAFTFIFLEILVGQNGVH
jgi:hypothetical protein